MRKNRIIVYFFTAVFLLTAAFLWIKIADKKENDLFSIRITSDGKSENIKCWQNEEDNYYVFLPSYADLSKAKLYLNTEVELSINGKALKDGMSCQSFELNIPYDLSYSTWGKGHSHRVTFLKSDNVATMYIDTESGNMEYIHNKKGNKEKGKISLYNDNGKLDYNGELESINGRGNNTWEGYDKKPYSLRLSTKANLLGMGHAQRWILLANAADASNIRNKIVYDFAQKAGLKYSPDCDYVELYLNGEYNGLYLLCERNEVESNRVNIPLEGSFVFSSERKDKLEAQNDTYIFTKNQHYLRIHYPLICTSEAINKASNIWQSAENAIVATNGIDSITGKSWQDLIDLDSWARKYLIEEIFGNLDGGLVSQYYYIDGNDVNQKIFAGPVWDYDHALGNDLDPLWNITNPNLLVVNRSKQDSVFDNQWFEYLYTKEDFYNRVVELYKNEYFPLIDDLLGEKLDLYAQKITVSTNINAVRWPTESENSDVESQTEQIRTYLSQHVEFLNDVWLEKKEYIEVSFKSPNKNTLYYSVLKGEEFKEIPIYENTQTQQFLGWYYVDTDEPFDAGKPIYEDTEVYAKWQEIGDSKVKDLIKLAPVGIIAVLFFALCIVEFKKYRKNSKVGK